MNWNAASMGWADLSTLILTLFIEEAH